MSGPVLVETASERATRYNRIGRGIWKLFFILLMVGLLGPVLGAIALVAAIGWRQTVLYRSYERQYRARWEKIVAFRAESDQAKLDQWWALFEEVTTLANAGIDDEDIRRKVMLDEKYDRTVAMSVLASFDDIPPQTSAILRRFGFYRRLDAKFGEEYPKKW